MDPPPAENVLPMSQECFFHVLTSARRGSDIARTLGRRGEDGRRKVASSSPPYLPRGYRRKAAISQPRIVATSSPRHLGRERGRLPGVQSAPRPVRVTDGGGHSTSPSTPPRGSLKHDHELPPGVRRKPIVLGPDNMPNTRYAKNTLKG